MPATEVFELSYHYNHYCRSVKDPVPYETWANANFRRVQDEMASNGTPVGVKDIKPGDFVKHPNGALYREVKQVYDTVCDEYTWGTCHKTPCHAIEYTCGSKWVVRKDDRPLKSIRSKDHNVINNGEPLCP